jgi:GNAT superfamily N-acetyltransferase
LLWIEANYRGYGYGKAILSQLEQYALKKHNIKHLRLNTGNFQGAVAFYQYLGYAIFAQLDIFPENAKKEECYTDYYMKKFLG